jgi:uncharacterized DUF497 family protein
MSLPEIDVVWDPAKARSNRAKHGISFAEAATVLADPLAITVFDEAHSTHEERWFTLGLSRQRTLLAVAHTYTVQTQHRVSIRIISARSATGQERHTYENDPR